jgi:hypothetical protein
MGCNWLIIFDYQTLFLKERMNITDHLHKLRISYRISLRHVWFLMLISTEHEKW